METAIVLDSVKKMLQSGLDIDVIKSTLEDLGLTDSQIQDVLDQASGKPSVASTPAQSVSTPKPTPVQEAPTPASVNPSPMASSFSSVSRPVAEEMVKQQEMHNLSQAMTHAAIESHAQRITDVHQSISELHDKVDDLSENVNTLPESAAKVNLLSTRLSQIEREIMEIKAQGNALQSLLSKVLETNRDVLVELQRRNER